MGKRILVPFDGSPPSERALEFATSEWPEATVTLLNVINPGEAGYTAGSGVPSGAEQWFESAKADAEELLAEATTGLEGRVDTMVEVGRPAGTIVEVADEAGYTHVVMGSHGREGIRRVLLGSVTEAVIRDTVVPVTVVP
ncbi:universal stress protein [Halobium salinum]|uniref:Universal stress protein n=1 Tax=Halobium salinum TaxID=1364940 RepID=A0ABD5P8K1_9EURY|nr:universal stress protein [Halobium salinum]